jgi:hypothetical protein
MAPNHQNGGKSATSHWKIEKTPLFHFGNPSWRQNIKKIFLLPNFASLKRIS